MKLTLEKVIGAIVVVVLGYMIYTQFLSRPTMVKIQKGKHKKPITYDPESPECKRRVLECMKHQDPATCIIFPEICKDT